MSHSRISIVDTMDAIFAASNTPALVIHAAGRVLGSGWTSPDLGRHVYMVPPSDGIQGLDFLAAAPDSGIHVPVVTPIHVDLLLAPIDIENYWGPGAPLLGVRVHAVENAKTAMFAAGKGMPGVRAVENSSAALSFANDIQPLFRQRDVSAMRIVAGFDLHYYADVQAHAEAIYSRLLDGSMPCDGAWPQADIARFRAWIDSGMTA
ncbi:hypothetical protein NKY39_12090 [Sinorhizobium meliloti]|uniref:hypothetical protein n=1 Tax=Rhizobium meliloti TaxID=382 RepID=UPI003D64F26D